MKLYSLSVLYKGDPKVVLLKAAYDVSSFSFFQRSSVQEFMTFTSQLIVERSAKGSRASVKEQEYLCHVYVRNDSLAGVVIADSEYPSRVAFTLLEKVLDEFSKQVDRIDWPVGSPATIQYTALDGHLSRYQNPREADPMSKVQAELDETKIILHNTMESLLERGEKLDDLVSKSEVLGTQSKAFYKTVSSCCLVLRAPFPHSHCSLFLLALSTRNRSFLVYITKVGFFAHLFILCFFDCWFFVFS
uniref:Synaptobrevin homolog YKT6 n=1 Tax=Castor canadensis TaxID=51338 RepID=A0A8C0ZT98_CASCN